MAATDKLTDLSSAVAEHVADGMVVTLEGFDHLIAFAAGHEIIRQGRRNLTLCRMTPYRLADQVTAGCVRRLIASFFASGCAGSPHEVRRRIERADREPLEIEEYSHYGMVCRYQAGAARLPFFGCGPTPAATCRSSTLRSAKSATPTVVPILYVVPHSARMHHRACPARRSLRQRADVGHRERPAGSRLRRAQRDRHCRGDPLPAMCARRNGPPRRCPPAPREIDTMRLYLR